MPLYALIMVICDRNPCYNPDTSMHGCYLLVDVERWFGIALKTPFLTELLKTLSYLLESRVQFRPYHSRRSIRMNDMKECVGVLLQFAP